MDSFDDKLRKQGEEIHKKAYDNQEKIEEALKEIKELEECCFNSNHPQVRGMMADVRRIKEILEK